jgi:hypothetical protein
MACHNMAQTRLRFFCSDTDSWDALAVLSVLILKELSNASDS